MQSISTNNLFMHGHEKWGASNIACPPHRKSEGAIASLAPVVPQSMMPSFFQLVSGQVNAVFYILY